MSDGTWQNWMYPAEPRCPQGTVGCGIDDSSGDAALFEDSQTTKVALEQLRNVSKLGGPWFVAAGYRKPHVQWRVPARILDAYPPASAMPLPATRDFPRGAPAIAFHQPVDDFLQAFAVGACFMPTSVGMSVNIYEGTLSLFTNMCYPIGILHVNENWRRTMTEDPRPNRSRS